MILNYLSLQVPKINYSVYPQIITTTTTKKKSSNNYYYKKKTTAVIELLEELNVNLEKALNTMTMLSKLKLPEVTVMTLHPE